MATNLRNKVHRIKIPAFLHRSLLHCAGATLVAIAAAPVRAQPPSPSATALAGAVTALSGAPVLAASNPAAVCGITSPRLACWFSPGALGIEGYADGCSVLSWPVGRSAVAVALGGIAARGFRQITVAATAGTPLPAGLEAGGALHFDAIAIDGYGSSIAPTIDAGIIAHLTPRIAAGCMVANLGRTGLGGAPREQRVAVGLAVAVSTTTRFSLDVLHASGRGADLALGITAAPLTALTLHAGAGVLPRRAAFGIEYLAPRFSVSYGGVYVAPLGLRQAIGLGIEL